MNVESKELIKPHEVSVIIPAHNAANHIVDCLESVLSQQNQKPNEIIVVDDGSSDSTYPIAKEFSSQIVVVKTDYYGVAATRNTGIDRSNGDIIVFIDADCVADKDWFANLQKPFMIDVDVVQGNIWAQYWQNKVTSYHGLWRRSVFLQKSGYEGNKLNTFVTRNVGLKREVVDMARKYYGYVFNPTLSGAEDRDLGYRLFNLGANIILEENAVVYHKDPTTLLGIMQQKYRHALYDVDAGIAERLLDLENFKRAVLRPAKDGVPPYFSLLLWLAHIYGCESGRLKRRLNNL